MGLFGIAGLRFAILQQMTVDTIFIQLPIKTEMKPTAKLRILALIGGMRTIKILCYDIYVSEYI